MPVSPVWGESPLLHQVIFPFIPQPTSARCLHEDGVGDRRLSVQGYQSLLSLEVAPQDSSFGVCFSVHRLCVMTCLHRISHLS